MPRALRIAVLILAILATLGVSMAAETASHFHAKPPANGCDICFTAHLGARPDGSVVPFVHAPQAQGRHTPGRAAAGYQFLRGNTSFTRGPPSSSL